MSDYNRLEHYTDSQESISHLVGIALDNTDGHKRLTRSESFSVVGGSQETHERMAHMLIKTMEDIRRTGKDLSSLEPEEINTLLNKHKNY